MSLEIIEKIREKESLDLALENALNKLKRAVKKIINARFSATCFSVWLLFKNVYQY